MAYTITARMFPTLPLRRGGSELSRAAHDGLPGPQLALGVVTLAISAPIATD